MAEWIFFLFLSLFNLQYSGANDSNLYIYYWIIVFSFSIFSLILYLHNYLKQSKFPKTFFKKICPIVLIISLYLISFSLFGYDNVKNGYYAQIFILMCVPSFLLGYLCTEKKQENILISSVINFVVIGTMILTVSLYRLIFSSVGTESLETIGGAGRLGIGYLATHFFIITFYIFLFEQAKKTNRINLLFNLPLKNFFLLLMLLIQVSTVLFSGSRGPLLNLLIVSLIMIIVKFLENDLRTFMKKISILFLVLIVIAQLFKSFAQDLFATSTERTLTLFQLDSENWAGGSGRESLYPKAIDMFIDKPIFGHGPMAFLSKSGTGMYPHNLFLECLVDYGLVGLMVFIIFLSFIIFKYIKSFELNKNILLIAFLFISTLIELQVSGSFMANPRFWFFIGFAMGLKKYYKSIKIYKKVSPI